MTIIVALLGWVSTGLLLAGYLSNAKKKNYSWLLWFAGNLIQIFYAIMISSYPILCLAFVVMIVNVYGYLEWKTEGMTDSTDELLSEAYTLILATLARDLSGNHNNERKLSTWVTKYVKDQRKKRVGDTA